MAQFQLYPMSGGRVLEAQTSRTPESARPTSKLIAHRSRGRDFSGRRNKKQYGVIATEDIND